VSGKYGKCGKCGNPGKPGRSGVFGNGKSWKCHGKVMEICSHCRTILQLKVNNIK
jgi:hypothetical protein